MDIICRKAFDKDLDRITEFKKYITDCIKNDFKFDFFTILKYIYLLDINDGEDFEESLNFMPEIHKNSDFKTLNFKIYSYDEGYDKDIFDIRDVWYYFYVKTKIKNNIKLFSIEERINQKLSKYVFHFDKNNELNTYSDGTNFFNRYNQREDIKDCVFQKLWHDDWIKHKLVKYNVDYFTLEFKINRYSNNVEKSEVIITENLFNDSFYNPEVHFDVSVINGKRHEKVYYKYRGEKKEISGYKANRRLSNLIKDTIFMNSENFMIADRQDIDSMINACGFDSILDYKGLFDTGVIKNLFS